jgi:hypothetical protein
MGRIPAWHSAARVSAGKGGAVRQGSGRGQAGLQAVAVQDHRHRGGGSGGDPPAPRAAHDNAGAPPPAANP